MRFTLTLSSSEPCVILPIHHNALIQAAIYHNLSPQLADFLHNEGYVIDKRPFRLFVFSRILGEYQILKQEQKIKFRSPMKLVISSPIPEFIFEISQLLLKDGIRIGNQQLKVEFLEAASPKIDRNEIVVSTLSPAVAYSTMLRPDGRKYTNYFEPYEEDFRQLIIQNIKRKGKLLYGDEVEDRSFMISPIGRHKRHLVKFKKGKSETIIKGYSGKFILKGDLNLLQTAIDAGIGSKNSNGFGMLELVENH